MTTKRLEDQTPEQREKMRAYFARYRAEHPALKDYAAKYYQANKAKWDKRRRSEKERAYMKAYRLKHRARLAAKLKKWYAENPERVRAIQERRRIKGRPTKRLSDKKWRQENPDKSRAIIIRSKAKKPELYRQIASAGALKRRARMKSAHTELVSLKRIMERDGGLCHLCGLPVDRADRTFDHLIPIVRNGAHAEWNLMPAHDRCNKRRGTKQILPQETKEAAENYIALRYAKVAA